MPNEDINTKVRITGDTTGLDKLGRAAKEAFNPRTAKQFGRAALEVNRELKQLVSTQVRLTKEMRGIDRGTEKYKKLANELENVNTEAKQLTGLLTDINRFAAQPSTARRQGFIGGLAQGAGVAQYIPSGPGMGARIGGAAIGGLGRRAMGGAAAPFVSPGVGGFAGALGAIPFLGQAAGAAVMAGHGYFQQAIAFDRARIENLPYAQIGPLQTRANPAYAQAMERLRQARIQRDAPIGQVARFAPSTERARQNQRNRRRVANTLNLYSKLQGGGAGVMGGQIAPSQTAELKEERAIRRLNRVTRKLILKRRRKEVAEAREELAITPKTITSRITGLPSVGAGAMYGFAPTAVQGMFGEYMGARGGIGRGRNEFRDVMVARRLFGVGAGLAGGYGRMMQPGAGGAGPGIAQTIATALATGLRGSLITEHLQTLVQQGRQMEQEGARFVASNMSGMVATLSAIGMRGMQPTRIMGQMQGAARGVSARGVSGPMDLLMARAAGYRPEGGAESYAAAMNMLAGGLSPQMMTGLLGQITQGAREGEWGPQMQRMLVRRAMGQMGVQVGPEQAGMLLQGFQGGQLTGEAQRVLADIQQRSGRMGAEGFARQARLGAGIVGGKAVYAAGAEAQQIATGNKLAGMYMNLERVGRQSVSALSGFASQLETASNYVLQAFKRIDEVAQKIGSGASIAEVIMGR